MASDQAVLASAGRGDPKPGPRSPRFDTAAPAWLAERLARADVHIGGNRPWDLQVHDARLYQRVRADWSLGAGEAYMDGDWDCERLDMLFERLLRAELGFAAHGVGRFKLGFEALRQRWLNLQSVARAGQVGERHYDAGNDLFERMLDPHMIYSCAYWEHARTLEEAQEHKLEMICRKLRLAPGQRLLDIGCGWGGLAAWAARRHGVQVVGITVSKAQLVLARERCAGLPVQFLLQDYRLLDPAVVGRFERIVSVGMFEHVGPQNHAAYFDAAERLLAPEGLFLLHTIGVDRSGVPTDRWIDRYVFPNGKLPSMAELAQAVERRFVVEDWHNFGTDYDRTLMAWHARFEAAWPELAPRYGERFRRLWRYYLLQCAGFFRSRQGLLWQLVLTHPERVTTYRSVRPVSAG